VCNEVDGYCAREYNMLSENETSKVDRARDFDAKIFLNFEIDFGPSLHDTACTSQIFLTSFFSALDLPNP